MSRPLKVLLVGNYGPDRQESMLRFGDLLHTELKEQQYQVRLISPPARLNRKGAPPSGIAKWLGYIDKFVLFPSALKRAARRVDIVHIVDHSNAMYIKSLKRKPHLITCHDVLAIQSAMEPGEGKPTGWSGKVFQRLILNGLKQAYHVACVSHKTREELLKYASLPDQALSVIHNGLNYPYSPMAPAEATGLIAALLKQKGGSGEVPQYILHVGANQWYKNRLGVLKIYARLRQQLQGKQIPQLIMVGKPFTAEMSQFISAENLQDHVIELQGVSNEDLRALYSTAQLLLFPSLAEGFGWPIAEAQACGCRVVTTNLAPMTEVGGNAAVYIDPADLDSAAKQVAKVLDETEAERGQRSAEGVANALQFAPGLMTKQYMALYQELLTKWETSGSSRH
jgi:glycosyltransferase involved in cell wall biosynthesis